MTLSLLLAEVWETLRRHPMRTILTASSVAWGVYMLVVLLGMGRGMQQAVAWQFRDDAMNSIWIYAGKTSEAYKGYQSGREVRLTMSDHDALADKLSDVEHITARYQPARIAAVVYGDRGRSYSMRSVHPDHRYLERTLLREGRYINARDLEERRKVVVIGQAVSRFFFGEASPLGEWLEVAGVSFRVVGVFEDEGMPGEEEMVYLPITTAQATYGGRDYVGQIMFTMSDTSRADELEREAVALLAAQHHFSPDDRSALRVRNNVERQEKYASVFRMLERFMWLAGIGTVLAGVVGVSNIMLVSVAERTSEIGLRKALGAVPGDILAAVVGEAVLLTSLAGYLGLVAGVATLEVVRHWLPDNEFVRDPGVDLGVVLVAVAMLVLAGALAGLVPARRAARVQPVEALRS